MIVSCINTVLLVSGSGLLVLCITLFVECIAAMFLVPTEASMYTRQDIKVTILVPAHNEETIIYSTLVKLLQALKQQDDLVVIADNCSDRTAQIARGVGATVIERQDANFQGKGYALDYGLRFLKANPPDIVVFIDADCEVSEHTIEKLAQCAINTNRPIQATYLMTPSVSNPKDSVSAFAFKFKNLVRPSGLSYLGLPCLLTGTGMAFPWSVINSVDIASGDIVEDMKLGLDLTLGGYSPVFCPQANVTGKLPEQTQAAETQRTRWEHGHLKMLTYVPRMLIASVQQKRFDLFFSALDLCIPPLSLFVLIWFILTAVSVVLGIFTSSWIPAALFCMEGLVILSTIIIAWAKFGRTELPIQQLLGIPFYILWKIPLYLKFLVKPQNVWVRTQRGSVKASES